MSRLSRHLLNLTLLLIAVSSHFELHEFFILAASGGHLRDMIHVFVKLVWSLVFYTLIQGVYNVASLGYLIKAILSVMLWIAVGRSCAICDGIYSDYLSAPANGILSRLSYIILSEKYQKAASVFVAVYSWKTTRLIAQWSLFSYFFKTHRNNDDMITKKYNSTLILPMADTEPRRVEECLTSCLLNGMRNVIFVTSKDNFADIEQRMVRFRSKFQRSVIQVVGTYEVEKSNMIVEGLRHVKTDLVVLVDPNVFWPHRFLDRLLESLSDQVGFAMLYQQVRRFKLPFKEVNAPTSSAQAEAARAIVIRLRALRFQAFRTSFREVQRANGVFYDEERSAHFLERLALEKGYSTLKGYAGYDAFEPPAHTADEPARGTHLIFNFLRYIRQACRMTFSNLLVTAARWTKMPSISYTSHAAAFFVSAFVFDCLMTAIITLVQRPQDWTLFIFGLKAEQSQVHGKQQYDQERLLRFHYIFGWCHGLVKIWAGMYLVLNFFGETDISFDSQDPRTVFGNRDDGNAPSSPSSAGSGISRHGPGRSTTQNIVVTTESTAFPRLPLRDQNTGNTGRDRSDRAPSPPTRTSDPVQRVRNSPSYRPGSRPLPPRIQTVPAEGVGNTPTSAVQPSRALPPIQTGQTRQELSPSLPNTPIEGSQLREEISLATQETQTLPRSPRKHEQQSFSRSPSPRTKARAQSQPTIDEPPSNPTDAASGSERRKRATRRPTPYDEDFHPSESELSSVESSSARGSRTGSVAGSPVRLRTPNFTPSQPPSHSGTPVLTLGPAPALPMPRPSPGPQRIPIKPDPARQTTPVGEPSSLEAPRLRVPKFAKRESSSAAESSTPQPPAKSKAKRAAPKTPTASPRRRCPNCRRLHDGDC